MSSEQDILKRLLLAEELDDLNKLKQKILSEEQFTHEVSLVLSGAIRRAQNNDKDFSRALARPIKNGVTKAFSDNKQSIVDSMLPIMGQLIRKTVTNSIKQFVSDINRVLEQKFYLRAIKWRWQAFKAGTSYAEMVFKKTISYQVRELFVINRENGLLIQHVGANDMLIDNNAVSAMLTAIQDFIGDSLQSPESGFSSAAIGDVSYFISSGPKAYLATVIKGSATERLKEKSQKLIENIHADFSELLGNEDKYQQDHEFDEYLRLHLLSKSISTNTQNKINWLPWIIGTVLLTYGLIYYSYQRSKTYHNIVNMAQSLDGLFLQSVKRKSDKFVITGLLDPLADVSILNKEEIVLNTSPYISLDESIIEQRIKKIVDGYKTVSTVFKQNTLTISGSLPKNIVEGLLIELKSIPGVKTIVNQLTEDQHAKIIKILNSYKSSLRDMSYQIKPQSLQLGGTIDYHNYHRLRNEILDQYPNISIIDNDVFVTDSTDNLLMSINKTTINLPNVASNPNNILVTKTINTLQKIVQRDVQFHLLIIGSSDCHGKTSNHHSETRANTVADMIVKNGINREFVKTKIIPCLNHVHQRNTTLLNVSFEIKRLKEVKPQ